MDEFYTSIENSFLDEKKIDERKVYLKSLNELYPDIHSYRNPKVLKHYEILKDKEPSVPTLEEHLICMKAYYAKMRQKHPYGFYWGEEEVDSLRELYSRDPPKRKKLRLSERDIKIANILKLQSRGVMICLSPKADYYPSIETFMDKVKIQGVNKLKAQNTILKFTPRTPKIQRFAYMLICMLR